MKWPSEKDMTAFFGKRGENQTTVVPPYPLFLSWNQQPVKRFTCHEKVADSVMRILGSVRREYGLKRIAELKLDQFSGCLNVRLKRGSSTEWSIHSWGAAIDWNDEDNALKMHKPKARFSAPIYEAWWEIWEEEGWVSLGRKKDYDWMHVQAASL